MSVKRTLEGNGYAAVDTSSLFISVFLDRAISCEYNSALTTVHTLYSDIDKKILYTKPEKEKRSIEEVVTTAKIVDEKSV